jgi:hypothetical protein
MSVTKMLGWYPDMRRGKDEQEANDCARHVAVGDRTGIGHYMADHTAAQGTKQRGHEVGQTARDKTTPWAYHKRGAARSNASKHPT